MLNVEPDNLYREAIAGIKNRRRVTDPHQETIRTYAAANYRDDWKPEVPVHENHPFEFIVNTVPQLAYYNPKVWVKSRRPVVQREVVMAMAHGLTRWANDVKLSQEFQKIAVDFCIGFGVGIIFLESLPGYEDRTIPPLRPAFRRLRPTRYFRDPRGGSFDQPRFEGHIWIRDKEDILTAKNPDGSPKFLRDAVRQLNTDMNHEQVRDQILQLDPNLMIERNQIMGMEIYVPERRMLYTLSFEATSTPGKAMGYYIRKPRRFFGDPLGPYVMFGAYEVPDQQYPLSPLAVTTDVAHEVNMHMEQISRQASRARSICMVDGQNPEMRDAVKNFADGTVAAIPNFNANAVKEISFGGPDKASIEYVIFRREGLKRLSGLGDVQRGQIAAKATATAVNKAVEAHTNRTSYLTQRFEAPATEVLRRAGRLMWESRSVVFPMPTKRAETKLFFESQAQEVDAEFRGGVQPGQEDQTYEDLEIGIQLNSMGRTDEATLQANNTEFHNQLVAWSPMILQVPWLNWPEIIRDKAETLNIPDPEKYVNWQMLEEVLKVRFVAGEIFGIPGLDGAPPVDPEQFKAPPGLPAGSKQAVGVGGGDAGETTAKAGGSMDQMMQLMGGGQAAAA